MLKIFISNVMFPKDSFISPFLQLINALEVARNGRPKITGNESVVRRRVEDRWLDLIGGAGFVCTGWTRVFHVFLFFSCLCIFSLFFLFPLSPTPFIVVLELVFIRDLRDAKAPVLAKSSLLITKPSSWPLILIM
jgi:hypothetical protein